MVQGKVHGFAVDIWALGVLTYELLAGTNPFDLGFVDSNQSQQDREAALKDRILKIQYKFPSDFPQLAKSFVSKVINKNMEKRLKID